MASRWLLALLAAGPVIAAAPARHAEPEETLPPALSRRSLEEEIVHAGEKRAEELKTIAAEREAALREKAALEKLRGEIEQVRQALREEGARLQKLVDGAQPHKPGADDKRKGQEEPSGPQLEALAKMVRSMKPEQAAAVMKSLEKPLAVALLRRLKPAEAGALLDKLDTALATQLVIGLSHEREGRP